MPKVKFTDLPEDPKKLLKLYATVLVRYHGLANGMSESECVNGMIELIENGFAKIVVEDGPQGMAIRLALTLPGEMPFPDGSKMLLA